jgi:hypothetical protein
MYFSKIVKPKAGLLHFYNSMQERRTQIKDVERYWRLVFLNQPGKGTILNAYI